MSGYDVSHFDEFQGLEASAVRSYLLKHGWHHWEARYKDGSKLAFWKHPDRKYNLDDDLMHENGERSRSMDIAHVVSMLADDWESGSVQKLLREMNPRMRKGMPSGDAIAAHRKSGGMWIGQFGELGRGGFVVFVCFRSEPSDNPNHGPLHVWDDEEWHDSEWQTEQIKNHWSFWPCDANGNKVRWPVDEVGNML